MTYSGKLYLHVSGDWRKIKQTAGNKKKSAQCLPSP